MKEAFKYAPKVLVVLLLFFTIVFQEEIKASITAIVKGEEQILEVAAQKKEPGEADPGHTKIFMSSEIPGFEIMENYEYACTWFWYSGHTDAYAEGLEKSRDRLKEMAASRGANALVNMRIFPSTFEAQGSKWSTSMVNICADMVKLRKK